MFLVFSLLTLSIFDLASAYNAFIQPPREGVNVSLNSDVVVKWQCDDCGSNPMNLSIFQDKHDGTWNEDPLLINVVNQDSYTWKARTLGLPSANGFHFTFRWADKGVDSGALFIRDGVSSSSISISSSTSIAATSAISRSSTPATSSNSFTTFTTSDSATPASTTSLAPGANVDTGNKDNTLKVGLGVGIGLGVPLLLIIGGIIGFILFKRRSKQAPTESKQEQEQKLEQLYEAPVYEIRPHDHKAVHQIQEMPHEAARSELPDSSVQDGRARP